jgi:hypothetical protein
MTLEIAVAPSGNSPAGHAAALTALSVSRRSFLGGVRVCGDLAQPLRSPLSKRANLGDALSEIGTAPFDEPPAARIVIGWDVDISGIATWWDGWRSGVRVGRDSPLGQGENPLTGVAAGALAVGAAFQSLRGRSAAPADIDLWPGTVWAPRFADVFLPSALWMLGLGNLGQAFLWSLGALPYADSSALWLFLQDYDHVSEENWGTSVLVPDDRYGELKTKVTEGWVDNRGFTVRRIDRQLLDDIRIAEGDPHLAISGLDKVAPRSLLAKVGFEAIIDAGLGRTARDFDRYRVSVFDRLHRIDAHFLGVTDPVCEPDAPDTPAYRELEPEIGRCGAADISNASVAVPYVSAVAAAVAISRAIALCSGRPCCPGETQRLSAAERRTVAAPRQFESRGIGHAGHPRAL